MKAYLDFQGFTKVIDIPRYMPYIMLPVLEQVDLYDPREPNGDSDVPILLFHNSGELTGADETIWKYKWDGKFPRSKE